MSKPAKLPTIIAGLRAASRFSTRSLRVDLRMRYSARALMPLGIFPRSSAQLHLEIVRSKLSDHRNAGDGQYVGSSRAALDELFAQRLQKCLGALRPSPGCH